MGSRFYTNNSGWTENWRCCDISENDLYLATAIQKQMFNTIYQLMALKKQNSEQLDKVAKLRMIPDYFHYLLTRETVQGYTNATTTQLFNPETKNWNFNLTRQLEYKKELF